MITLKDLSFNLKMAMSEAKIKGQGLSELSGVEYDTILNILDQKEWPSSYDLHRIARALGTTSSVLMNEIIIDQDKYNELVKALKQKTLQTMHEEIKSAIKMSAKDLFKKE